MQINLSELKENAEAALLEDCIESDLERFIATVDPAEILTLIQALEIARSALSFYCSSEPIFRPTNYPSFLEYGDDTPGVTSYVQCGTRARRAIIQLAELVTWNFSNED